MILKIKNHFEYLNELKKNTSESYVLQSVLNEMFSMICEEKTSVAALDKKIEEFRAMGCTLFAPKK
mgnify:CR=1 FL=1